MRSLLLLLPIALFLFSFSAISDDEFSKEVRLRETPNLVLQETLESLPTSFTFQDKMEFSRLVNASHLNNQQLKSQLMLLARGYMLADIKVNNRFTIAKNIIDSLEVVIDTPFEKSMLLMLQGRYIGRVQQDYSSAIRLYKQALDQIGLQASPKERLLKYILYEDLGLMHRIIRQDDLSLSYLNQCKTLAFAIENSYLIVQAEIYLGRYHQKKKELTEALEHFTEAIVLSGQVKMPALRAELYMQIARVYKNLAQWDDALKYTQEASVVFTEIKKEHKIIAAIRLMAMIYSEKGQLNYAIDYHLTALQSDIHLGNHIGQAIDYHNLGEAYFRNEDYKTAFSYLKKADIIFSEKKTDHYLVYNDLLLADVSLALKKYPMARRFAINAYDKANKFNLLDEKKQALQLEISIYKHLNDFARALTALESWIQLDSITPIGKKNDSHSNAILAQQKLQSTLFKAKHLHNTAPPLQTQFYLFIGTGVGLLIFMSVAYIGLWRNRQKLKHLLTQQSQYLSVDPLANIPGYRAFISALSNTNLNKPSSIILCSLTDQLNADLSLGFQNNRTLHQSQHTAIAHALNAKVYHIRSGLFALLIPSNIDASHCIKVIRNCINAHQWQTSLHIGLLNLPLHANPAIKIDIETHFGTAQMMLAGAMSLGKEQDFYVTMTTFDFAPATIFSSPLYQQLKRNIERGLIKIETNGDKNSIIWP
ncbi:tetratricopeptide repeat protein [Shewanella surugensis]|uniref:Tetratricopeptide repeat protein n=1 Tax=Shewanella surugensis TaxID=212020 RepID=A0ABT0LFD4_9GAMM|nr:tetratricopeptide repeat protein [Shewanella surugensis]MCL1126042.1 tetratricopeptide repeat protein [Shewanella surugensis]